MKRCLLISIIAMALLPCEVLAAPPLSQETSTIVYHYQGKSIRDSQWGPISQFQRALSASLVRCGKQGIAADGWFGAGTQAALMGLLSCPEFKDLSVNAADPLYGAVHVLLWKRLLPGSPEPTVHERAFALSLSQENTDYDQIEWNYGTSDESSVVTWGPYGATAGHGREVQGILRMVEKENPGLLKESFGNEYPTVVELIAEGANGHELLKRVFNDTNRRAAWKEKFKALGGLDKVRKAYDQYAVSDQWLKPAMRQLYGLIPGGAEQGSEIDYAFFLDNAIHMAITSERIAICQKAIAERVKFLKRELSSAERRQIVSLNLVPSAQKDDRLGRDVVYYVDGVDKNGISQHEYDVWLRRSGRKASACGLSDLRKFKPDFL